jgi:hypothetical protein
LEEESRSLGLDGEKTLARARELRVAALMVRDEARVVARNALASSPGRDRVELPARDDKNG